MNLLALVLLAATASLQYVLWLGKDGLIDLWSLRTAIAQAEAQNERLRERNEVLNAEVIDLKTGVEAVEERARTDLGLIREGEIFIQIIDADSF